jgi:spermidine/putrescine transport system substrate-binding protein
MKGTVAMPNEIDPRLLTRLAANRTSRRRFIGGGAAAAARWLWVAPSWPRAARQQVRDRHHGDTGGPGKRDAASLQLAAVYGNGWSPFRATGTTVDYKEDFNDSVQWFAKNKEPLTQTGIGADLVVPTQFMAARLMQLKWLNEISDAGVPNKKNLRPDLPNAAVDPGRKFTAPYMTGMVGLACFEAAAGRDIKTVDDLWTRNSRQGVCPTPGWARTGDALRAARSADHRGCPEGR